MTLSDSWIPQWSVPGHAWAGNLIRLDYNRPWAINCRQGSAVAFMTSMKTCFNERYKTGIGWCWEGETYLIYGKWMIERSLTDSISVCPPLCHLFRVVHGNEFWPWVLTTGYHFNAQLLSRPRVTQISRFVHFTDYLSISQESELNTFIIPVHYITSFITPMMIPT